MRTAPLSLSFLSRSLWPEGSSSFFGQSMSLMIGVWPYNAPMSGPSYEGGTGLLPFEALLPPPSCPSERVGGVSLRDAVVGWEGVGSDLDSLHAATPPAPQVPKMRSARIGRTFMRKGPGRDRRGMVPSVSRGSRVATRYSGLFRLSLGETR